MIIFTKKLRLSPITLPCIFAMFCFAPCPYILSMLVAVFLHEMGHIVAMKCFGVGINSITLLPMGISIEREHKITSYFADFVIALAGAGTNLVLFACFFTFDGVLKYFAVFNLLFAALNLLPISKLDGGVALWSILSHFASKSVTEWVCRGFSFVFCILLWVIGTYVFFVLNGNISLFVVAVFLFYTEIVK